MSEIVVTSKSDLREYIRSVILEIEAQKAAKETPKLYSINQVAKKLGKAHATISKMVATGLIKATKDNLIPETSINEYLGK